MKLKLEISICGKRQFGFCKIITKYIIGMKLVSFLMVLFFSSINGFAQLPSQVDNSQYAIAQMIDAKAKQRNLGAIHRESPKMRPTAGKSGWFLRYERGWVYYNPKLNKAFAIMANMMKKWGDAGYEIGWMGFPISDNVETPKAYGFYTAFENGSIYSSEKNGIHYVGGAFRDEWAKRGYENSTTLGFPKTDEIAINNSDFTRYQQFERGTLFFGKDGVVVYVDNPNAINPPIIQKFLLTFKPFGTNGGEGNSEVDGIDLYGWMDIRVYNADGTELKDIDDKSFSLFNIPKEKYLEDEGFKSHLSFTPSNGNFIRNYMVTQTDMELKGYIRIIYWLNDYDRSSSNDYLKLQSASGTINYNNGNHPYRDIKLYEISKYNGKTTRNDYLTDGSGDSYTVSYTLSINK